MDCTLENGVFFEMSRAASRNYPPITVTITRPYTRGINRTNFGGIFGGTVRVLTTGAINAIKSEKAAGRWWKDTPCDFTHVARQN
jgi:hypothetical protein